MQCARTMPSQLSMQMPLIACCDAMLHTCYAAACSVLQKPIHRRCTMLIAAASHSGGPTSQYSYFSGPGAL